MGLGAKFRMRVTSQLSLAVFHKYMQINIANTCNDVHPGCPMVLVEQSVLDGDNYVFGRRSCRRRAFCACGDGGCEPQTWMSKHSRKLECMRCDIGHEEFLIDTPDFLSPRVRFTLLSCNGSLTHLVRTHTHAEGRVRRTARRLRPRVQPELILLRGEQMMRVR